VTNTLRESHTVQPGQILGGGKFRVERVLGEGGMGVVCAATHLALGQLVALKFMLPQAMRHPEAIARFEREARAAVRLKSDHVARVSDVGRLEDGAPYIVMEYLEGEDLDAVIDRGALPVETAVDYVLQACEAVAEAHALGIIHRDLKPKNLFLTRRLNGKPLVKVLDFGISKSTTDDLSLTSTTQTLGSPNYMSPEQLRVSRDVDVRSDVWSLGVILFELLTGRLPFEAETVTQLTAMVLQDEPPNVSTLRSEVPAHLALAIARCLEKKREARFQNVAELSAAIAPFASAEGAAKARDLLSISGRTSQDVVAPPEPTSVRVLGPNSSTHSAWDRTQLQGGSGGRRGLIAGVVIATIAVLGTATFEIARHRGDPQANANPVASTPLTSATPTTVVTPATSTTPFTVAATQPTATTPPAATTTAPTNTGRVPTVTTARTKPDAGAPHVDTTAPPSSSGGTFQLPNVRN